MPDGDPRLSRQQRRRTQRQAPTFQDFHDNSGGAFGLTVLRGVVGLVWLRAFGLGEYVVRWLDDLAKNEPLCADCETVFRDGDLPVDWVLLTPLRSDPSVAILMGVCARCSHRLADDGDLTRAVAARLKAGAYPDLKMLDPASMPNVAGRA